jgi:hypothetical protein
MRISALLFLLPAILAAQPPANQPAPPATKPEDLCALSGQVLNAVTGEPLRRASIVLMRADVTPGEAGLPLTYSTSSNANGQFSMKDIEPGKYRLNVTRNGFVQFVYGARSAMRPGTTLTLIRHQRMTDMSLKLTPHAVITGRILDDEGEPLSNVRIMLQGYRYMQGRKQLTMTGGGGSTNDLGEFRLFGIAPGKYFLSATPVAMNFSYAIDRSATPGPEEDFVATYYPGTLDPSSAAQLDVAAGAQVRGIDMVLSRTRTVRVKGRVIHGLAGRPNVQVMLAPRNQMGFMGVMRGAPLDPAGNFEIRNVTPGAYILTATVNESGIPRQGRMPVDVGNSNLEGVSLTIGPGLTVQGRARIDADSAPFDISTVRLTLQPREPGMFVGGSQAKADADGAFELKSVSPDRYYLNAFGLPSGAYIKSARMDQVDVLTSGLDLTNGVAALLEVVISPRAASVTGTVQNQKTGNPAPGATVVLIPQDKTRREQQAFYKMLVADQHGAFSLTGVPPGDYKAFAWEDLDPGAWMDPDFVKPVEEKGETVTLREGEQKSLPLKLIAADAAAN